MSLDLDAIKARCEAATPGPWYAERGGDIDDRFWIIPAVLRDPYGDNALNFGTDQDVAEFVAHARTDVPELVAEVERLREDLRIANEASAVLLHRAAAIERGDCPSVLDDGGIRYACDWVPGHGGLHGGVYPNPAAGGADVLKEWSS